MMLLLALAILSVAGMTGAVAASVRDSRRPMPTVSAYDTRRPLP
jgi:hypothetical protein